MSEKRYGPGKVGISAALLILGLLVSMELPPGFLNVRAITTVSAQPPLGRLVVAVALNDEGMAPVPMAGVQVGVSSSARFSLPTVQLTNASGEVELPLAPGAYGVGVSDQRFTLDQKVQVASGNATILEVRVNKTAFAAGFAQADGSTSTGVIGPWNRLVVQVLPPDMNSIQVQTFSQYGGQDLVPAGTRPPDFGSEVFVQTVYQGIVVGGNPGASALRSGQEVPAKVVSRWQGQGSVWLTLQPLELLDLFGATHLLVLTYQAGSSVSYSDV